MRKVLFATGVAIGILGLGIVAAVPYFYYHSNMVSSTLLAKESKELNSTVTSGSQSVIPISVQENKPIGILQIPSLNLKAPILQGIKDEQINVAVGHLPTSVLPGEGGTSVLAAHNATWFRHVDRLKAGDLVNILTSYGSYTFRVTGSKVVHVGSDIMNTVNASIVLESCYPLDALYLTPYRYLVSAELLTDNGPKVPVAEPYQSSTYSPKLPNSLPISDSLLSHNSLPMGTLTYEGHPSDEFTQSNAPLSASDSVVALYLDWLHASSSRNTEAFKELGLSYDSNPLWGININSIQHESKFNVTLNVQGNRLLDATAVDIVHVHHTFKVTVHVHAVGNRLVLQSVDVRKLNGRG